MAKQKMIDVSVYVGNATKVQDLSGGANESSFTETVEERPTTAYADLAKRRIGSLQDSAFSIKAWRENAEQPWADVRSLLGDADVFAALIESNSAMAEGDHGRAIHALASGLETGGAVGDVDMFLIEGVANGPASICRVMQEDVNDVTVTGTTTGFQWGALASGETAYAIQFVLAHGGGTLDTVVQSDTSGFSSPTTRMTFTQSTAVGAEIKSVAGPVTDDYWRLSHTVVTGPFTVLTVIFKITGTTN